MAEQLVDRILEEICDRMRASRAAVEETRRLEAALAVRAGRVTLGPDFKPQLALSVKGHWQAGDPQNFIKVYLDAADVGGGTQMRGYFRYKIFPERLVIKLVAIRKEHGGKDTTVLGDHTELVSDTGT